MTGNLVFPRNAFLGFDHVFDALQNIHVHANDGYPPHNVVKADGKIPSYSIEMAVAGFGKKDVAIEVKEHILTIKGNREKRREAEAYVHKGISNRKFEKSFRLSEQPVTCLQKLPSLCHLHCSQRLEQAHHLHQHHRLQQQALLSAHPLRRCYKWPTCALRYHRPSGLC